MKSSIITAFIFGLPVWMLGQEPVLTVADFASEGEAFVVINASPAIVFDGDNTGPDHSWNFSELSPLLSDTVYWVDEEDTDPYYFFLWLNSDIAEQTTTDIATDFFTLEDVFNFYEKDGSSFEMSGFAGIIGGIPLPVSYDENDVVYKFPLEYGNEYSSSSEFSMTIPGIGSWEENRERETIVDGWGSLTTPAGTYNALRLKSISVVTDFFEYDTLEIPFTYTLTEYKWLAAQSGIPVLQINVQDILGSETVSQVIYRESQLNTFITDNANEGNALLLTPLTSGELYIQVATDTPVNLKIEIYDVAGKCVYSGPAVNGKNTVNTTIFSPGFYLVSVITDDVVLKTLPFIHAN